MTAVAPWPTVEIQQPCVEYMNKSQLLLGLMPSIVSRNNLSWANIQNSMTISLFFSVHLLWLSHAFIFYQFTLIPKEDFSDRFPLPLCQSAYLSLNSNDHCLSIIIILLLLFNITYRFKCHLFGLFCICDPIIQWPPSFSCPSSWVTFLTGPSSLTQ